MMDDTFSPLICCFMDDADDEHVQQTNSSVYVNDEEQVVSAESGQQTLYVECEQQTPSVDGEQQALSVGGEQQASSVECEQQTPSVDGRQQALSVEEEQHTVCTHPQANMPLAPLTAAPPARPQKSSTRIVLRGKLDSLNAQIVFLQALSQNPEYISDLEELRQIIRTLQICEASDQVFADPLTLWGLSEDEIHSCSHNPAKFYGRGHILPHYDMQKDSAGLNLLRTLVREVELAACNAFPDDALRLCHVLNRLSSAVYILTYKYLPKEYNHVLIFHGERRNSSND